MRRDEGTNAVRFFIDNEGEQQDEGLVVCLTAGVNGDEINVY